MDWKNLRVVKKVHTEAISAPGIGLLLMLEYTEYDLSQASLFLVIDDMAVFLRLYFRKTRDPRAL